MTTRPTGYLPMCYPTWKAATAIPSGHTSGTCSTQSQTNGEVDCTDRNGSVPLALTWKQFEAQRVPSLLQLSVPSGPGDFWEMCFLPRGSAKAFSCGWVFPSCKCDQHCWWEFSCVVVGLALLLSKTVSFRKVGILCGSNTDTGPLLWTGPQRHRLCFLHKI